MAILLTPRDLLLPSGAQAALEVEVESRWAPFIDPARPGVEVDVDGHGRGVSGPDGVARIPLKPLPDGLHRLRVRAGLAEAEAVVRVAPPASPVLITDIDHTIADVSSVGFIFKASGTVRMVAGARDALAELAPRMSIVYLSARDHIFVPKTRGWLQMNGFPEGPLYLRAGTRFWSCRSRRHKMERLAPLRAQWKDIRAGVGDVRGDMEAYAAHGIPPVLIGGRPIDGLPSGTACVKTWIEILGLLKE